MKKTLTMLLVIVLLLQAAPLSALAVGELPTTPVTAEKIVKNGEAVPQEIHTADGSGSAEEKAAEEPVRAAASGTVSGRSGVSPLSPGALFLVSDCLYFPGVMPT